jgi:hypothetical protein
MAVATRRKESPQTVAPEWFDDLSDAALRESAGDKVFERGLAYWREGRVELVREDALSADFDAHGSDIYEVKLRFDDPGLNADCDCPHAQDGNFCKHVVAAVLVWRQHLGGDEPRAEALPADDAARGALNRDRLAKAARTRAANAEALQAFLNQQPAPALAQRLWTRAQVDRDLMAEIKAWAAQAGAAGDPKALRKAVDELLKASTRLYLEKRDIRAWSARAQQAVALLRDALPAHGTEVRAIVESAFRRAEDVQSRAPDAYTDIEGIVVDLTEVLIAALQAAPPPAAWAEHVLKQQLEGPDLPWSDQRLVAAAGPEVARAYSKRLADRWARAPAPSRDDYKDIDSTRGRLRRLMLADLERQGDPLACFEFQKNSAVHAHEFVALIHWCEEHARPREALQMAQAAVKRFPNYPQLEDLLLEAYERDGWDEEVLAIWQRRFDKFPSPEFYQALIKAGRAAGADLKAMRHAAFAKTEAHEADRLKRETEALRRYNPLRQTVARDVSWRAGMHMLDGELDAAIALVQPPHACDLRVLEALADRLDAGRGDTAFELLRRCFEASLQAGRSPYTEPLRLLAKALQRLNSQKAQAFLLSVGQTYRAKTSFIAGLARLRPVPARGA